MASAEQPGVAVVEQTGAPIADASLAPNADRLSLLTAEMALSDRLLDDARAALERALSRQPQVEAGTRAIDIKLAGASDAVVSVVASDPGALPLAPSDASLADGPLNQAGSAARNGLDLVVTATDGAPSPETVTTVGAVLAVTDAPGARMPAPGVTRVTDPLAPTLTAVDPTLAAGVTPVTVGDAARPVPVRSAIVADATDRVTRAVVPAGDGVTPVLGTALRPSDASAASVTAAGAVTQGVTGASLPGALTTDTVTRGVTRDNAAGAQSAQTAVREPGPRVDGASNARDGAHAATTAGDGLPSQPTTAQLATAASNAVAQADQDRGFFAWLFLGQTKRDPTGPSDPETAGVQSAAALGSDRASLRVQILPALERVVTVIASVLPATGGPAAVVLGTSFLVLAGAGLWMRRVGSRRRRG